MRTKILKINPNDPEINKIKIAAGINLKYFLDLGWLETARTRVSIAKRKIIIV